MEKFRKTALSFAAFLLLAGVANAAGVIQARGQNQNNENNEISENNDQAVTQPNPSRSKELKNIHCPLVNRCNNIFISGEFLYWQAHENGLAYAFKTDGSESAKTTVKNPHFDWEPGFRVGIGYNLPHDQWEISLFWTSFYDKAHGETFADDDETLMPLGASQVIQRTLAQVPGNTATTLPSGLNAYVPVGTSASFASDPLLATGPFNRGVSSAKAHWRLNLNEIDLEIANNFLITKWLSLKPHGGFRTAWIHQTYKTEYSGVTTVTSVPSGGGLGGVIVSNDPIDKVKVKNDFWGIGLIAGLDTEWNMCCNFSVYIDAAISLLYGFFDIHETEFLDDTNIVNLKDSFRVGRAITDLGLGLRWDYLFSNEHNRLVIQGGWEHHMFFGQNQMDQLILSNLGQTPAALISNKGDLAIQGYTIGARFDF